jgi:hypothetical protein
MSWFSDVHNSIAGGGNPFQEYNLGDPRHGFKAGFSAFKVFSPTMMLYDSIQGARKDGVKGFFKAGPHNIQNAFKDNWPALLSAAGVGMGAGGASSGASGGDYGKYAQMGMGLLGGGEQQQSTAAPAPAPVLKPEYDSNALALQMELQRLRMKPNKTMEE